jgi:AAA domain, putative AbiEii toxin, Type IV TA system
MLQQLDLRNFKAFERFTLSLRDSAFLVGPNSAGKSTIISALRLCGRLLQNAYSRAAGGTRIDQGRHVWAYSFGADQLEFITENLRHDFEEAETRIELKFRDTGVMRVVWPTDEGAEEDNPEPFFHLENAAGLQLRRPKDISSTFSPVGIIPMLSPLEHQEAVLEPQYVRRNLDGRLASRHFRNQLYLLTDGAKSGLPSQYDDFLAFIEPWLPELTLSGLRARMGERQLELDLFYKEAGSRVEKEIFWAGDGIQVWLQLLLHIFRLRSARALVIDEPDIYLHADLQRRLVRLLESLNAQVITATHSPEILAEASPDSVVWVDKTRKRAIRAPGQDILSELSESLGSQFNLRLARALRSKVILFVEGDDLKILRDIASNIGANHLASETGIAVIPLQGFTNWKHLEPFKWMVKELLKSAVKVFVILDRDYRSANAASDVVSRLGDIDIEAHVWERKELESYLLEAGPVARVSGLSKEAATSEIGKAVAQLKTDVFAPMLEERQQEQIAADKHRVTITKQFQQEFEGLWADPITRLKLCPPKKVINLLNQRLTALVKRLVSARKLAKAIRPLEVPPEMADVIRRVERALGP